MAHKLVTIAVIGLTTSAVCMGAAAAIGGPSFGDGFDGIFDSRPRCQVLTDATETSRTLDWDGSERLGLSINGHARYTPGSDERVHASGDPQVLAHLRVHKGDIELDCRGWRDRTQNLAITLPGREFRKFDIAGGGHLILDKLDQSALKIEIAGSGSVKANGRIDSLQMEITGSGEADFDQIGVREADMEITGSGTVKASGKIDDLGIGIGGSGRAEFGQLEAGNAKLQIDGSGTVRAKGRMDNLRIGISGSGRADFGEMISRKAKVKISGHGIVDIAPDDEARIDVSGSGDVTLHSDPKKLETDVSGSGRIHRISSGT